MEFNIITDLEKTLPAVIDFNYEEIKTELAERLSGYKTLVVTEDAIKDGKADRAKLNGLKKAIDDRRKSVKAQCLAPYMEFEAKCKELCDMIDDASGSIDRQVKAFEDAEKAKKREDIEREYSAHFGNLAELITLDRIFNSKWLNKTVSITSISEELAATAMKAKSDIEIIRGMKAECEDQMMDAYIRTLDMSAALSEKNSFEERKKRLAEYAAEQQRKAEQYARDIAAANEAKQEEPVYAPRETVEAKAEEAKTITVVFYDTTAGFRAELRTLTEKYGVRYGGVK